MNSSANSNCAKAASKRARCSTIAGQSRQHPIPATQGPSLRPQPTTAHACARTAAIRIRSIRRSSSATIEVSNPHGSKLKSLCHPNRNDLQGRAAIANRSALTLRGSPDRHATVTRSVIADRSAIFTRGIDLRTFPVPSRDNPGGKDVATSPRSNRGLPAGARISDASRLVRLNVDIDQLRHHAKPPASGDAYDLEVRNGAAGKGPRLKLSAINAESIRGDRSPEPIHSSSDSLALHQPGSMTWGGRIATPAPSGRARYRVNGPAVTRFNSNPSRGYMGLGLLPALGTSAAGRSVTRWTSRGGVDGHAARPQRERRQGQKRTGSRLSADGARSQPTWKERVGKAVAPAGINPGPRETNSVTPERESASRVRSIAVHGLMGMPNVSGISSAVLLTNADPDAVKGALCLQHVHCPATIQGRLS